MSVSRQFWGPRDEQTITLTAAFQFTGAIDVMDGVTAAENIEIKHGKVSYTVLYASGTANIGRAEVVTEWAHLAVGPFFRPASDPEIALEVSDGAGDANNIVSVCSPGGMRFVRFGVREIGDTVAPGDVETQSSGEYIL